MATRFKILIANKVFDISALFDSTRTFCKDYITDASPDFEIAIHPEDIQLERDKAAKEARAEGREASNYPDDYLETLAVYRKVVAKLLDYDILLFHGSVIAVDGTAYLFAAKSGTGKSTHARLWREYFGDRAVMINDDKPLLQITDTTVIAYGTPWNGKHHLSNNISAPLKAICFLERERNNHIFAVDKRSVFSKLCQQSYRPDNAEALSKTLSLVDRLGSRVELYRLDCNMEQEAAVVAYRGMTSR